MKKTLLTLAAFAVTLLFPLKNASAITGETMENPFFDGGNYSSWTLNSPWRNDGAGSRLIFDVNNTNPMPTAFIAAVGTGRDLATAPEITGDASFTNADDAILTGFTFNNPYNQTFSEGNITGGDYKLFFEVDVVTADGTYRAKSDNTENPWQLAAGTLSPIFAWETGGFLGDPSDATGGGIALSAITDIEYRAVMQIDSVVTNASTGFFALDNLSLTYNVSSVPEPSSYALVAGLMGLGLVVCARRRM